MLMQNGASIDFEALDGATALTANKLSMKALAEWLNVLVDSIFKIQIVLEWVFQQIMAK